MEWTYEEIIKYATASVGLFGCLFIISTTLLLKELWTFNFRLILYLAISNAVIEVAFLFPSSNSKNNLCRAQGFIDNYGNQSSLLLTGCIMRSLHRLIIFEEIGTRRTETICILISFVLPAIASTIPLVFDDYQPAQGWCWCNGSLILILLEFYAPYSIVLSYNITICWKISNFLKHCKDEVQLKKMKITAFKRFIWYPAALLFCYSPVFLHRFYSFYHKENSLINVLGVLGNTIYAVACTVVYASTRHIRSRVFALFCPCMVPGKSRSLTTGEELI